MNSTKYGGLEKYFVELQKCNDSGINIYIYESYPLNSDYVNDVCRFNGKIYVLSQKSYLKYILAIAGIIRKYRIDVVQFHFGSYETAFILRILFPRIKLFAMYHSEIFIPNVLRRLEHRIYHKAFNKIFCVSAGVKMGIERILGKSSKYEILYLGVRKRNILNVDLKKDLCISDSTLLITCIGFDVRIKGLDILIKSLKMLVEEGVVKNNLKLIIVGVSGEENDKLNNLARKANVEQYVVSLGIRNDIDDILNITDIYVQPSRTEAISLSIMEALNYSLPIVATNVGGISEVVENGFNGYLCEKENVEDLYDKLKVLIENVSLRKRFGENSLKKSVSFLLDNSVKKLINIYKE